MGAEYVPIVPQLILVIGGMLILLMEPFTAPARKSLMGRIAIFACALAAAILGRQGTGPRTVAFQ